MCFFKKNHNRIFTKDNINLHCNDNDKLSQPARSMNNSVLFIHLLQQLILLYFGVIPSFVIS